MKWADLARACARASLLSPAPETVAKAKRILLTLANYTFEFEHYDVGLNYAIWAMAALDACDSLKVGPGELQSLEVSVTQGGKTQSHRIPLLDRAG